MGIILRRSVPEDDRRKMQRKINKRTDRKGGARWVAGGVRWGLVEQKGLIKSARDEG